MGLTSRCRPLEFFHVSLHRLSTDLALSCSNPVGAFSSSDGKSKCYNIERHSVPLCDSNFVPTVWERPSVMVRCPDIFGYSVSMRSNVLSSSPCFIDDESSWKSGFGSHGGNRGEPLVLCCLAC